MVTYEPFQFDHYLSFQRSYTATEAIIDLRGTHPVIMSQRVWLRDLRPLSDEAGTILRWEEGPENEGRLADVLPPEDIAEDGYDEGYDLLVIIMVMAMTRSSHLRHQMKSLV
jgi:hypothetical protein